MKVTAITNSGDNRFFVTDKAPDFRFKDIGDFIYSEDNGVFKIYSYLPRSKGAFGGSPIEITMEDGTTRILRDKYWDEGFVELGKILNRELVPFVYQTVCELKKHYIFNRAYIDKKVLEEIECQKEIIYVR